ncbi:MAG: response regulator [Deltaproteobacteria bacterium]|nr:response regulator [Deltaproteobacteria bacterium]
MANTIEFQNAEQRNYNILLVDDDSHMLEVIDEILLEENYQVIRATSGEAAIELLNTKDFDLVITDLNMGKANGIAVLKRAKELNHETMVIIMTGNTDVAFAIEALRLDVDDYLLKPFNIDYFLDRVSIALRNWETHEALRSQRCVIEL